jgi:hypothetical protein
MQRERTINNVEHAADSPYIRRPVTGGFFAENGKVEPDSGGLMETNKEISADKKRSYAGKRHVP